MQLLQLWGVKADVLKLLPGASAAAMSDPKTGKAKLPPVMAMVPSKTKEFA